MTENIDDKIEKYLNESRLRISYNEMAKGKQIIQLGSYDVDEFLDDFEDRIFYLENGDGEFIFITKGQHWYEIGKRQTKLIKDRKKLRELDDQAKAISP